VVEVAHDLVVGVVLARVVAFVEDDQRDVPHAHESVREEVQEDGRRHHQHVVRLKLALPGPLA
jgi:hypothetical protein